MSAASRTPPCPRPAPRARRGGFTLVELLVVIGIIALLISILLPSLNSARESAKSVKCLSNMRQLGQASVSFGNDHKGYVVKAWFNDEPNDSAARYDETGRKISTWGFDDPLWGWDSVLLTYVDGAKEVFRCPSDGATDGQNPDFPSDAVWNIRGEWSGPGTGRWPADQPDATVDDIPASYRHNSSNQINGPFNAAKFTQIKYPSDGFLIVEAKDSNFHHVATWENAMEAGKFLGLVSQNHMELMPFERHKGRRLNYMFYDGHASTTPWDQTWRALESPFEYAQPLQGGAITKKTVQATPWRTTYKNPGWQDIDPYVYSENGPTQ